MKDIFPEYYSLEAREKKHLWNEATFVFDANVLLNLYRYSEKTREDFLSILEKMDKRIWLPHQFALEYQRGRLKVIEDQLHTYADVSSKLTNAIKNLHKDVEIYRDRHPFLKIG